MMKTRKGADAGLSSKQIEMGYPKKNIPQEVKK